MNENIEMVKLTIDGIPVEIESGKTILDASKKAGIKIPTLCFLKKINEVGDCRICLVEIEGLPRMVPSCITKVANGMVVKTNTDKILKTRKTILKLILSNHNKSCLTCIRNTKCELQDMTTKFGIKECDYEGSMTKPVYDDVSACIVRDTSKCILCRRCVSVCKNVQSVSAIGNVKRGFATHIGVALDMSLANSTCVGCGQCIINCPTAALKEKSQIDKIKNALNDEKKHVVVQVAPAIRAAIGEEFNMEVGIIATGKLVAGLRSLGFSKVFDTDVAADITILEEGTEFLNRLNSNENLPMITSCSSGWITFAEKFFPEILKHLSSTKSPMEIMGTMIKTYYAKKENIDNKDIYSVAVMPCSAKKAEIIREELKVGGMQMVDAVLTTRELARLLKEHNIDISNLKDEEFDIPFGDASGSGVIFGTTGGVMEAALRTLTDITSDKPLEDITFEVVRGVEGIKEATVKIGDKYINIAVAQGLANVRKVTEEIANGTSKYHFIEVMTCPGGCIMGGGQPFIKTSMVDKEEVRYKRAKVLYNIDAKSKYRLSNKNESVLKLYDEFLGKPNGETAHELLHTKYSKQEVYVEKD